MFNPRIIIGISVFVVILLYLVYITASHKSEASTQFMKAYLPFPHLQHRAHRVVIFGGESDENSFQHNTKLCKKFQLGEISEFEQFLLGSVDVIVDHQRLLQFDDIEKYLKPGGYLYQNRTLRQRDFTMTRTWFGISEVKKGTAAMINFSNQSHELLQIKNSTFLWNDFIHHDTDVLLSFAPNDFDDAFWHTYKELTNEARGFMYWCWKSACIESVMQSCNAEYIVYCDASTKFLMTRDQLLSGFHSKPMIAFELGWFLGGEYEWNKRDCVKTLLQGYSKREIEHILRKPQVCATASAYHRDTQSNFDTSLNFIQEWSRYCCKRHLITDDENVLGEDNFQGFSEHRHDQSVASLLYKTKYKSFTHVLDKDASIHQHYFG
jgi:hypothetical protein